MKTVEPGRTHYFESLLNFVLKVLESQVAIQFAAAPHDSLEHRIIRRHKL